MKTALWILAAMLTGGLGAWLLWEGLARHMEAESDRYMTR